MSFPQAFSDLFLVGRRPVVITGTHGKTTTTAMTTWLLHAAGLDPGMLVGGVALDFGATYRIGQVGQGAPFVVEGDEYDTAFFDKGPKFLHYRPQIAVLNNIEFDHADIYDDLDEIIANFDRLMDLLGPDTLLLANADDERVLERAARTRARVVTYGFSVDSDLRATEVELGPLGTRFVCSLRGQCLGEMTSPMAGRHNIWNSLAACAVGLELGVPFGELARALPGFSGVKKRQEERGEVNGVLVIDDYAHHPTAIRETLHALRARYPGRRLWAVYEAKSNTARRNIHQADYAEAFLAADRVIIGRPYVKKDGLSDRDKLDVDRLIAEVTDGGVGATYRAEIGEIIELLADETARGDVVAIMSGSGFGGIHDRLLKRLRTGEPEAEG